MQCLNRVQALLRPLEQLSQPQNKWLDYDFTVIGISQRFPWRGSDVPSSSTGACLVSPQTLLCCSLHLLWFPWQGDAMPSFVPLFDSNPKSQI